MTEPTHRCLLCGTQYFAPGVCDWDGVQLTPIAADVQSPLIPDPLTGSTLVTDPHQRFGRKGGMK